MPLSINTNVASMAAQRSFMNSNSALETSFERLSSGQRINSAVDDAAGLSIGKDLQSRVSGLNQAIRNTNDAISMVQIAEGAMDEATNILHRMRDLAVQGASDSLAATERGFLETESDKLITAYNNVMSGTKWNGAVLFGTTQDESKVIQIGADDGDTLTVTFNDTSLSSTGYNVTDARMQFDSQANASDTISFVDSALSALATDRAQLGATQTQLESTVRNLANVAENTAAAAGRIMDTDYAAETANLTKAQILQQAATSILAQANAQPQAVLSLLQ
jgi:flagellin